MHKTHLEGVQLAQKVAWSLEPEVTEAVEVVVHPPFTALRSVGTLIEGDKLVIGLGAQDCHPEPEGAFTGEVSAPMLAKLGCRYVIVGHSERREHFGENDELVSRKGRAVLASQMRPIVCVGESLQQREQGRTAEVVEAQVRGSLVGLTGADSGLVVAYEPVWAIGTGRSATPRDAQDTITLIRRILVELAGAGTAEKTRILYGGSVKPGTIAELMAQPDIDGALVGGASIKADDFAEIVKGAAQQVKVRA
jgi:triosephosphate isomerase (TIM)